MKQLITIFISFILSVGAFGQTYKELIVQAESLYNSKDFKESSELYKHAFTIEKKKSSDLYNGACSAALSGDKKNAFSFLNQAIKNGWANIDHIKKDPDLESLHNEKAWAEMIDKLQKKVNKIENNYDKPLQKELLEIFVDDQNIRNKAVRASKKLGDHNPTVDSLVKIMKYKDSLNLIKVTRILDKKGWIGKDKVGEQANQALFLVIQHADLKTQEKYLPMMHKAVKEGDLPASFLPVLEDRVALRQGKKQIYGSQLYRNQKTNAYYVAPLEDPDNVDKRRTKVGLDLLADYVKKYDIIWNVEEYKRQLPALELLNKQ